MQSNKAKNGGEVKYESLPELVKWWPAEAREAYEERASIKEFDGRMPRDQAEREAEAEVRQRWKAEVLHA